MNNIRQTTSISVITGSFVRLSGIVQTAESIIGFSTLTLTFWQ